MIKDKLERQQALDITQSFIVQAPAGSGKTELLIQRYLALLAHAKKSPEEVLAITFTRKAAAEMRTRIINVLNKANANTPPATDHEAITLSLATQVLQRNKVLNWELLQNTYRLNILTIDAFNQRLVQYMPVLTKLCGNVQVTEDAHVHYLNTVHKLFSYLDSQLAESALLQNLFLHLDNDYQKITYLLIAMLKKRDQWLPYIADKHKQQDLRSALEKGLKQVIFECLQQCCILTPHSIQQELIELACYAANNLIAAKQDLAINSCSKITQLPSNQVNDFTHWLGIAELLLTGEGEWRKPGGVNKRIGFPPENKAYKARMQQLLTQISHYEAWRVQLENLRHLPPPEYTDQQWFALQALLDLLPKLAAHLTVEFNIHNAADFTEIALHALDALGDPEAPTELALMLDYQIQHILVDEFQDTSPTQMRLLEQLTIGWEPNDGRTLFLVGDPMQSIYRFREADVGLFLRARHTGINGITLQPLTLQVNFRSQAPIVAWINQTFTQLFPKIENISEGAVPYAAATAIHTSTEGSTHALHILDADQAPTEAAKIINIIQTSLQQQAKQSIAILVRSRNHLAEIVIAIKQAGLAFSAPEIEKLEHRSLIQDLFSLTRALTNPADRIAWLAILRAPWCGLTLADLHILADHNKHQCLIDILTDMVLIKQISVEGQQRLCSILPIMTHKIAERGRFSLRNLVETTWLELSGPACLLATSDIDNAEIFFQLLETIDYGGDLLDAAELERKLAKLYATSIPAQAAQLQIMTIHKAKGLEFDTVIIPSLHRSPTGQDKDLILWWERPRLTHGNDLLLAPINAVHRENNTSIYGYLEREHKKKSRHEAVRLLYVGATRARKNLHLIMLNKASAHSFAEILKPVLGQSLKSDKITTADITDNMATLPPLILKRLPNHLMHKAHEAYELAATLAAIQPPIINSLPPANINEQSLLAKHAGTIIHRCLQTISEEGLARWNHTRIQQQQAVWNKQLLALGIHVSDTAQCLFTIEQAIINILEDKRGRWILSAHQDAYSEYPLSAIIDGKLQHLIIDRTFIDEHGIRWIIDYKSTADLITENMPAYQLQLHRYAQAMSAVDQRPIKMGLYFLLNKRWHEIKSQALESLAPDA